MNESKEQRVQRYIAEAERDATALPEVRGVQPRRVERVAVVGAGTMGTGIAIAALDAGLRVELIEQDGAALERGSERIRSMYASRVQRAKLTQEVAGSRLRQLTTGLDWERIADADLVIEAVFEDLAVKQEVFARLDAIARKGAVLATNTSYLDVDAIAAATSRPTDFVGMHFFSPAHVMRLLEIVRGRSTSPDVLLTCVELAKKMRKVPVLSKNAFGFIGNRVYAAYRRQCEFLLEEGATPQQVDEALVNFGFAMGPFAVADMSGLDIAWRMRQSQAATRDPRARYVRIPDMLCEAGRLGQKTGAGYYRYDAAGARSQDAAVDAVLETARAEKALTARSISDDEIVRRALLVMANEAALLLQEGVAARATDVDVVLLNGYGFPKAEGGPVFWAREQGRTRLEKDLDWLGEVSGAGFIRGNANELFRATGKEVA